MKVGKKAKRLLSIALSAAMVFSMGMTSFATDGDEVVCTHHPGHTAECGYQEASAGTPCNHVHDDSCGYKEAVAEIPCDKECTDLDGDGVIDHVEGCAYTPAVEGSPCNHQHDESCGYTPATESSPCTFVCEICSAKPAGHIEGGVAQIDSTTYATLDDAVAAAADGATIELLADATTEGLNLSKDLTIKAAEGVSTPTITFTKYGIALWGKALTFKDVNVVMNSIGSTPYTAEWNWVTICASKDASLSLDNVNMIMDGDPTGTGINMDKHAIYFCSNNKLNLTNGTVLTIKNYTQDALEWDGGDGGYNVNITNSAFISDHNRSGFTGTFYATIDNSTVKVINSLGNGSNGTYYTIKNNSNVLFDRNVNWGISAWRIDMTNNSTLTATNNGYSGIWTRVLNVDSTCTLDVEENGNNAKGFTTNAGIFFQGNGTYTSTIEKGANVTIKDNAGSGIYTAQKVCNLTIGSATIIQNGKGTINVQNQKGATYGGGIYNVGKMVLDDDVILYNNHADTAGDDIYNADTGTVTFGKVGSDWVLDGAPDCTDAIDGWYYDGYATDENGVPIDYRWNAHGGKLYAEEYTDYGKTFVGMLALKAAHNLVINLPEYKPDWGVSKSKTATNLDENFESKVTLSLPSAEEQLVSDIVFVLDKSTSAALEDQALAMLQQLKNQIDKTNAQVKVGVVIFNKKANVSDFMDLTTQYADIEAAIKQNISSGTNTHAGLLAGKAMLDVDTNVEASRKYLVFVSDGITYMYNSDPTVTAWTFKADQVLNWAGPDNWNSKYGSNDEPNDWTAYLSAIGKQVAAQGNTYEYPYGGTATNSTPVEQQSIYANSIDKALYLTYMAYQDVVRAGYHCYAVKADTGSGSQYLWGPSFMNFLAGGKTVDFSTIQNDIFYLVAAGSRVEDYIGYVKDDYDFDFVNDASKLSMKVGDDAYNAIKIAENQYGFAPDSTLVDGYRYILTYNKGNGKDEEHFVWKINVPVSNFAPVQLTYTVKLTNPKTIPGTYGQYDENGSQSYTSLYTNNSAILYPVDTNNREGQPQEFPKPTVSYTVGSTPIIPDPVDPTSGVTIKAIKMMDNEEAQGKDFTFELLENGVVIQTVHNRNDKISFSLRYSRRSDVGTHYYTIREVNGGDPDIVYDTSTYDFVVEVSETGGIYSAKIVDKYTPIFNNYTYVPEISSEPSSEPVIEPSEPSVTPSEPEKEPEEVKPIDKTPQTSDESDLALWLVILGASAVGLIASLIFEKKNRYQPRHYR